MNKHNKLLLFITTALILASIASATTIYGGETKTVYEYTSLSAKCVNVSVDVTATSTIDFTNAGVREYSLANCMYNKSLNNFSDNWDCACDNGTFDLIISTLPNTINTYTFNLNFTTIQEPSGISGGENPIITRRSTSRGVCTTEWECTEWSECSNSYQTRSCSYPTNFCEPEDSKPELRQSCEVEVIIQDTNTRALEPTVEPIIEDNNTRETETEPQQRNRRNALTGLVTGANLGDASNWFAAILLLAIIGSIIFFIFKRKKPKTKVKKK